MTVLLKGKCHLHIRNVIIFRDPSKSAKPPRKSFSKYTPLVGRNRSRKDKTLLL